MKQQIVMQFEKVAKEQNKKLAPLTDDLLLLDSGLDSLCFAIIVSRLEDQFGVDPFSSSDVAHFPLRFGDFVDLYANVEKH